MNPTCPTTCNPGGCAQGATCLNNACVRCWSAFTDSFANGAAQWMLTQSTVTAGDLVLSVMSRNTMPETSTAQVTTPLPLRGCGVTFELTTRPDTANNFSGHVGLFRASGTLPSFRWEMDSRGLVAAWSLSDGGVGAQVVSSAAPSTWPRWLRIEEASGQVRFRTATTTSFTTVQTVAHSEALDSMVLRAQASFPAQPGGDRATFAIDNVNLGP